MRLFPFTQEADENELHSSSALRIKSRLIAIFKQALMLRAQLLLSTRKLKCRMYEGGARFNPSCMDPHERMASEMKGRKARQASVKTTLLPAIMVRKEDRMRVNYGSLLSWETDSDEECWSKAFVVLKA